MDRDHDRTHPTRNPATTVRGDLDDTRHGRGELAHLSDLDGFEVAGGEPDIRGWKVKSSDDRVLGKVDDLLVDTDARMVRYLELKLNRRVKRDDDRRHLLIPIGSARLDDEHDEVLLSRPRAEVIGGPRYDHDRRGDDYERALLGGSGTATGAAPRAAPREEVTVERRPVRADRGPGESPGRAADRDRDRHWHGHEAR